MSSFLPCAVIHKRTSPKPIQCVDWAALLGAAGRLRMNRTTVLSHMLGLQPASPTCALSRSSTVSTLSTSSTSPFQVLAASSPDNSATYGATDLARVLPVIQVRARGNVECLEVHSIR